jgi:uncharacterized protein involved in outer membrane biogenesis
MKKIILRVGIVLLVLVLAGVIALAFALDNVIRQAVVRAGPKITGVPVELNKVSLSLLNGEGSLEGFVLGNPPGYTSPSCIQFDQASLALEPGSLLADKVIVRHVRLTAPVITFEGRLRGNNFSDLRKGMPGGTESGAEQAEAEAPEDATGSRKLQVNEFTLTGARLNVIIKELGGQPRSIVLPDIQLKDLGTGPEGITSRELTRLALDKVFAVALQTLAESGGDMDKIADAALDELGKSGNTDLEKAARGVLDLFKKKE